MNGEGKAGEELGKGGTHKRQGLAEGQGENRQGVWGGLEAAVMGGGKQGVRDGSLGDPSAGSLQEGSLAKCISQARGKTRNWAYDSQLFQAPPPGGSFSHQEVDSSGFEACT